MKGGLGHTIALDEAHEMCVNRNIKMAVVRAITQAYLKKKRITFFLLPHQS